MLVGFIKRHPPAVQATCLGTMQNLSSNGAFHERLLGGGTLEALDSAKDAEEGTLAVQCATVLYNFSLREQSLAPMLELGGIFLVTQLSYSKALMVRRKAAAACVVNFMYSFDLFEDGCISAWHSWSSLGRQCVDLF